MINAGEFNKRISIVRRLKETDADGFETVVEAEICKAWAKIRTTKGFTLIANGTDFLNATTGMTIRKPIVDISRKDTVRYNSKEWSIKYIVNIDEDNKFIELQVEEVTQNG